LKKKLYILTILLAFYSATQIVASFENDYEYSLDISNTILSKGQQTNNLMLNFDIIDFGFVLVGESVTKNIYITNNGTNKFEINSVSILQREGSTFNIITNYTYPKAIGPGEKVIYEIQFTPLFPKNFFDTLLVVITDPVSFIYKIPLSGASVIENIIWSPDTIALIGVDEFKLPIKVRNTNKDIYISGVDYRLVLNFDADLFYPIGLTKGEIVSNEVENGKRILTITDEDVALFGNEQILTEIIGFVLLGNNPTTIVNIQEIIWNKDWIRPNSKNGELHTYGLCGNTISQIKWTEDTEVWIDPNPANQKININLATYDNGKILLQIFSYSGELCQTESIEIKNPSKELLKLEHSVNINDFPSGLYYIIITCSNSSKAIPLSIVK
jgi:hypothetical protein